VDIHIAAGRDPKDDMFLELAVSGHATHMIGGDVDLLVLDPCQNIRIVTPRDFLEQTANATP
jgi:predicted nucleic acid-binding protein